MKIARWIFAIAVVMGAAVWIGMDCYAVTEAPKSIGGPAWLWGTLAALGLMGCAGYSINKARQLAGTTERPKVDARNAPYEAAGSKSGGYGLEELEPKVAKELRKTWRRNFQTRYHIQWDLALSALFWIAICLTCYGPGGMTGWSGLSIFFLILLSSLSRQENLLHAKMTELLLKYGRCPACAYSLRGLSVETDGCTICPECSHAWRIAAGGADPSSAEM